MPAPEGHRGGGSAPPVVVLRYWAAAKAAAGTAQESFRAGSVATLEELLTAARRAHPDDGSFARVLEHCSFLVDGDPVGKRPHSSVDLRAGAVVEALPPFAGG